MKGAHQSQRPNLKQNPKNQDAESGAGTVAVVVAAEAEAVVAAGVDGRGSARIRVEFSQMSVHCPHTPPMNIF